MTKETTMPASTYPLRLPSYLMEQARQVAEASGSSLNQFFVAAIAEKVGEVRATLKQRAAHADVAKARGARPGARRAADGRRRAVAEG
jgi:hypothetical protein